MAGSPSRMLMLLSLLQTRRDWPGRLQSERLEVSGRTLRRDVEHLRDLGYRIVAIKGPDGGHRLDAGSELPPLPFDDDQAVAVAVALQVAAASGAADGEAQCGPWPGCAAGDALAAASSGRRCGLHEPSRHRRECRGRGGARHPERSGGSARGVRFDYVSVSSDPDAAPSRRRAEPHHVVFGNGRGYLVAWDLDVDDWRVYRLDQLTPRVPTGPRFSPRTVSGGDVCDFLASRTKGSDHGNQWPCTGEVVLGLPAADVLPFVPDGIVEPLGPDQCRLVLGRGRGRR